MDLERRDEFLVVHVESSPIPVGGPTCGVLARVKDRRTLELVDLPIAGTPTHLSWRKRRWCCLEESCPQGSWTEEDSNVAPLRHSMTT